MTKLYELFAHKPKAGDFGIEIECEGKDLAPHVPDEWNIVDDGSLRGRFPNERAEYVLRKPLSLDGSIKAVADLRNSQLAYNARMNFSFRTSVHVHMNVQQLTYPQYLNLIYTYLLVEEPLVRYCGDERVGNRFCLRLQDAEGLLDYLFTLFRKGPMQLDNIYDDAVRYAAINIAATKKYGSLEFRAMRGNLEVPYISTWLKTLYNLREFAKRFDNPQAIHDHFVKTTPSEFMAEVLGDTYMYYSYPQEAQAIRNSFSITLELPYNYVDNSEQIKQIMAIRDGGEPVPVKRHRNERIFNIPARPIAPGMGINWYVQPVVPNYDDVIDPIRP